VPQSTELIEWTIAATLPWRSRTIRESSSDRFRPNRTPHRKPMRTRSTEQGVDLVSLGSGTPRHGKFFSETVLQSNTSIRRYGNLTYTTSAKCKNAQKFVHFSDSGSSGRGSAASCLTLIGSKRAPEFHGTDRDFCLGLAWLSRASKPLPFGPNEPDRLRVRGPDRSARTTYHPRWFDLQPKL